MTVTTSEIQGGAHVVLFYERDADPLDRRSGST